MLLRFWTLRVCTVPTPQSLWGIHADGQTKAFYSNDAAAKKKLVNDVRNCCLHNGFFQITGHSVPLELQNKIMEWNKRFFDLSLEQKMEVNKGTPSSSSHSPILTLLPP